MATLYCPLVLFAGYLFLLYLGSKHTLLGSCLWLLIKPERKMAMYLSHHVLPVDKSLKSANCC